MCRAKTTIVIMSAKFHYEWEDYLIYLFLFIFFFFGNFYARSDDYCFRDTKTRQRNYCYTARGVSNYICIIVRIIVENPNR
jgi:hypothetical protein